MGSEAMLAFLALDILVLFVCRSDRTCRCNVLVVPPAVGLFLLVTFIDPNRPAIVPSKF